MSEQNDVLEEQQSQMFVNIYESIVDELNDPDSKDSLSNLVQIITNEDGTQSFDVNSLVYGVMVLSISRFVEYIEGLKNQKEGNIGQADTGSSE